MSECINILLVDDEQRNLEALEAILAHPSYRLLRANEADKALRLLLEHDIAAIVLDIKMPVVSGFELAKIIKGTKRFRHIPIVFLTAYLLDDADVLTGYHAGAVDYLMKPVNPAILRHKIAIFADLFRKTRALAELNEHLETRVRERTAKLEASEEALREADKQKDLFLATLAHELRNPLAPLRTGLDSLLQQADVAPSTARTLHAMDRQLSHVVRLIDDLMDVARIRSGRLEVRQEDAELGAIVERAVEAVQPTITRNAQQIVVDRDGELPVFADPTRVAQIVANLLSNASKHSPVGATIRIELRRTLELALVRVVDHGAGIPTDQLERVFGMFSKIERTVHSNNDGLGIGLALSRQLAEVQGGTLDVASAGEGQGATFTLALPLSTRPKALQLGVREVMPRPNGGLLKVLVVEDNEDAADMMSAWLEQHGYQARIAHTGPDALALMRAWRPQAVLCDIGLPDMSGLEVCRRVVEELTPPPLMIALTGWGTEADRQRTVEAGFHHHLVKPVSMEKLFALLQSADDRARAG